jgi:hypothetical protein
MEASFINLEGIVKLQQVEDLLSICLPWSVLTDLP